MKPTPALAVLGLALALAACTGGTPAAQPSAAVSPAHNTDAAEQGACARFQNGPAVALAASVSEEAAPEVKADRRRYDLTLPPTGSNPADHDGFVKFVVPRGVEWSFFFTKDVPIIARDASGLPMTVVEKDLRSKFCAEVKAQYIHLFDAGPVTVELGPTSEATVGLAVEETHPTANN